MGAGIAFVAARAGYAVDLVEPDTAARDRAKTRIGKDAQRAGEPDAAARVNYYSAFPDGAQAQLAIEAVPERLELKRELFRAMADALGTQGLLATNTSSLSVSEIALGVPYPERVLGLHFFNPPPAMKLVEIVRGDETGDEALALAQSIVERMGKTAVITADTPGFIVNRVARPYYLQSLRALDAGVAPIEEIDRLARGAGFRMGPFELMDFIGIDVNLATSESVYERTGEARLEPVALQRRLVAEQRLGRKTQAGFYDYADGPPVHDDDPPETSEEVDESEHVTVLGYGRLAIELQERLAQRYANVTALENDDLLDEVPLDSTIVFDGGDGVTDRAAVIAELDSQLPPETIIFADAYATDIAAAARRMRHPERLVGYGILGSIHDQRVAEIVDAENTGDDALELAQDLFESIGLHVALVADTPALYLGRTIGSVVNEAVHAVQEGVASAQDVDLAMKLGTNYPYGPIEWGCRIGGARLIRILQRLAGAEGGAFAPHRALRLLDVEAEEEESESMQTAGSDWDG
jgi:3-hydroxybutyryl-CoA dehydrogenase